MRSSSQSAGIRAFYQNQWLQTSSAKSWLGTETRRGSICACSAPPTVPYYHSTGHAFHSAQCGNAVDMLGLLDYAVESPSSCFVVQGIYNGLRKCSRTRLQSQSLPRISSTLLSTMEHSSRWLYLIALLACVVIPIHAESAGSQAYTPSNVGCPSGSLVRSAGSGTQYLNSQESAYISGRKQSVLPSALSTYLSNVRSHASTHGIQVPAYVSQFLGGGQVPAGLTLGIAVSGGGYRAAVVGGGLLNALDGRNGTSARAGTGGLLQSASYLSGLSGGSWLISGLTQANFPPLHDFMFGTQSDNSGDESHTFGGILAQNGFIDATSNIFTEADYVYDVVREVCGKMDAGFPVTITDVWARVLARHFVNGTSSNNFFNSDVKHGAGLTWSSAVNVYV